MKIKETTTKAEITVVREISENRFTEDIIIKRKDGKERIIRMHEWKDEMDTRQNVEVNKRIRQETYEELEKAITWMKEEEPWN